MASNFNELVVIDGENTQIFSNNATVSDVLDYINRNFSGDSNITISVRLNESKQEEKEVKESIVEDVPEKEYTIWSSSDFSDSGDQIPLVKLTVDENGELNVVEGATGTSAFDVESENIAKSSIKSTIGRKLKDRLLRIDKSLNHNDPFLSTELQRNRIRADRGETKTSIRDILGTDPDKISDEPRTEKGNHKVNQFGVELTANQILMLNRDDLKAAANLKSATEEKLVDLFEEMTGVNYYTEKVTDQEQYDYLLDLLGRSSDKYNDTHVSPKENEYVMRLKDLTEDLIEKVLIRNDPDNYAYAN